MVHLPPTLCVHFAISTHPRPYVPSLNLFGELAAITSECVFTGPPDQAVLAMLAPS